MPGTASKGDSLHVAPGACARTDEGNMLQEGSAQLSEGRAFQGGETLKMDRAQTHPWVTWPEVGRRGAAAGGLDWMPFAILCNFWILSLL